LSHTTGVIAEALSGICLPMRAS